MSVWVHRMGWDDRLRMQAWMYSLTAHALIIALMMALGARITLDRQDDPFRWNVAMVEAVSSQESPAPAPPSPSLESPSKPTPRTAPSKPMVQRTSKPVPVERRVETTVQPVVQRVETAPQNPIVERTSRPVETAQPLERRPIERVERMADVRPSAVETPLVEAAQSTTAPAAIERPAQITATSPAPLERRVEAQDAPSTREAVQRAEATHQSTPAVERTDSVVTERTPSQPVEQIARSVIQQAVEASPVQNQEPPSVTSRSVEPSTSDKQSIQAVQGEQTIVAKAAPTTTPNARRDYGWVRDALWRRIVEMKHYPAQARLNHLEGKVILRAVIKADGHLGALSIKESSGHQILDEAAMDVIRRVCPLPLKHDLGKPEIVVMIPIDYRLE